MKLKKIEKSSLFLQETSDWFSCPLCHEILRYHAPYSLSCDNGHRFDLSKKGTLFFLQHQVSTEYDKEMFLPRQRMIAAGMYQPLLKKIQEMIQPWETSRILDIGCGEGSFLKEIVAVKPDSYSVGMDISKEAVMMATNQELEKAFWCVADLTNLPFSKESTDLILNIFSPSHYQEFHRVLKKGGHLIKVVPGENYLKELRQLFFQNQKEKQAYSNQAVVAKFAESFSMIGEESISYQFPIGETEENDLLLMSPLQWGMKEEKSFKKGAIKEITVDLVVLIGEEKK